jgi:hypothetical protein
MQERWQQVARPEGCLHGLAPLAAAATRNPAAARTWCRLLTTNAKVCCQSGLQLWPCTEVSPLCSTARAAAAPPPPPWAPPSPPPPPCPAEAPAGSSRDSRLLTGFRRPRKVLRLQGWVWGGRAPEVGGAGGSVDSVHGQQVGQQHAGRQPEQNSREAAQPTSTQSPTQSRTWAPARHPPPPPAAPPAGAATASAAAALRQRERARRWPLPPPAVGPSWGPNASPGSPATPACGRRRAEREGLQGQMGGATCSRQDCQLSRTELPLLTSPAVFPQRRRATSCPGPAAT